VVFRENVDRHLLLGAFAILLGWRTGLPAWRFSKYDRPVLTPLRIFLIQSIH